MKKDHYKELFHLLATVESPKDAEALCFDLVTPRELDSIVERLQIFKMLAKKVPHRTISTKLDVSIDKVTRGSHAFKRSKKIAAWLLEK